MGNAIALKSLMEQVFGKKAWLDLKHCQDLNTWKKYTKRLLSSIEVSIKSTVQISDDDWLKEISSEIEHGKKTLDSSKELDILFANLSAALASISFLQIGFIPQRFGQQNVAAKTGENWKLDAFRSVQYVQTNEQKERAVLRNNSNKNST